MQWRVYYIMQECFVKMDFEFHYTLLAFQEASHKTNNTIIKPLIDSQLMHVRT